jgi:hypothetical protein
MEDLPPKGHVMTSHDTPRRRPETADAQQLDRSRQLFLLARAQVVAGRAEPLMLDAARRRWRPHRRRFS